MERLCGKVRGAQARGGVDLEAYKRGYYGMRQLNPSGIVPIGPAGDWTASHGREALA